MGLHVPTAALLLFAATLTVAQELPDTLDVLEAVVGVHATIPGNARTASTVSRIEVGTDAPTPSLTRSATSSRTAA